jgi:transketolase
MCLEKLKYFKNEKLDNDQLNAINNLSVKCRKDILRMTTSAGSGHIGGSLSSVDLYIILWLCANIFFDNYNDNERDRIVISHGHTSAAVYSVLGNIGFFNINDVIINFRKDNSIFEGHPNIKVPGIDWGSGSLGQGLSVGCGFALAAKIKKQDYHVFVVMGDGEQAKGQIQEAREFAVKYNLSNMTAIVDFNKLQASGKVEEVMPQNIAGKYIESGWKVISIDGHNYSEIYEALRACYINNDTPTLVLANTVMGKGISFIENNYEYHGKILNNEQLSKALKELGNEDYKLNNEISKIYSRKKVRLKPTINTGKTILYSKDEIVDCRTAFGKAIHDIAINNQNVDDIYIALLDCDLEGSLKLRRFKESFPQSFIECGLQEQNAATVAGALSKSGILTFLTDFGVFGIDETYGQLRMNDLNNTSLKLICTHNGLDVGEDGKTHQCIDYIGIISNLFGFKILIPADANQTDRLIRYAAVKHGNMVVVMGRSKIPILTDITGKEFFNTDYIFEYGKADWLRKGNDGTIITYGNMVYRTINAHERLKKIGIDIGVLNISCPLELDTEKIKQAADTGTIITYEDHNIKTGIGSIIGNFIAENQISCCFKSIGITDYGLSASPDYQYKLKNMDEDSLVSQVVQILKNKNN